MANAACPKCGNRTPVYDGVNPFKLNTVFCLKDGRQHLPEPEPKKVEAPAVEEPVTVAEKKAAEPDKPDLAAAHLPKSGSGR